MVSAKGELVMLTSSFLRILLFKSNPLHHIRFLVLNCSATVYSSGSSIPCDKLNEHLSKVS